VDLLEQLVHMLERGGPWTVTAVCMLITAHLYRELRTLQRTSGTEKQELNDRLIKMTEKHIEVLTINNENHKQIIQTLRDLED
jgi:hypothetical protein